MSRTFGQQISDIKRKHCGVLNGNQNGNFQTFDPRQRDGSNKQLKYFQPHLLCSPYM